MKRSMESLESRLAMTLDFAPVLEQTFDLHSNEGATHTIYLDFDGHVEGNITVPPYSSDADAAFSEQDLLWIQQIFEMVAEDFRPFDVDVTTEDTGNADIYVAIGGECSIASACPDFGTEVGETVIVFGAYASGHPRYIGNITSHMIGDSLGLEDDGVEAHGIFPAQEYYPGHGVPGWAPLMGYGFQYPLTQWSDGSYPYATEHEDDVAIIASQLGLRADDYTATTPISGTLTGVIGTREDVDVFSFVHGGGLVAINVQGVSETNLDLKFTVYRDGFAWPMVIEEPARSLNANITTHLPAGNYTLHVEGVGKPMQVYGEELDPGYSDYGSLGQYQVTVSVPTAVALNVEGDHRVGKLSWRRSQIFRT